MSATLAKQPERDFDYPASPSETLVYHCGRHSQLGRERFVVYFSKYLEVTCLSNKTSEPLIMAMKDISACHGIPEKKVLDYMPFNSLKFKTFATDWEMKMVTSSPPYPKSNGLVERNVQTMKRLLNESKHDAIFALLELLSRRLPQTFTSLRTKITW